MDGSLFAFIYNITFLKKINSFHGGMLFSLFINNKSYKQLILGPSYNETKGLLNSLNSKMFFHGVTFLFC